MCHAPRYKATMETQSRPRTKDNRRRTLYRYTITAEDGRVIMVSRWRTSKDYTASWARKTLAALEQTPS